MGTRAGFARSAPSAKGTSADRPVAGIVWPVGSDSGAKWVAGRYLLGEATTFS
jgi:hypothetical protein